MSDLPKGWAITTLGNVAAWGSGGTPSRSEPAYYGGSIPWIKTGELGPRIVSSAEESITELGLANSSAKFFPAGSVAIAMYGATIGKTSILGIAATTNQACAVGTPHTEITSKESLYHFLCSQKDAFVEAGKGGAQPNISQGVIKDWEFPLAPLPEQKRIADKLDSVLARVDACRDRLGRIPALLKRFRQSILAAATSGRLTEDWRTTRSPDEAQRNPGSTTPDSGANVSLACLQKTQQAKQAWLQKNSAHNEAGRVKKRLVSFSEAMVTGDGLPTGWCWAALEDAALMVVDCHNKTAPYEPEGIALVRTTNVRDGRFVWEDLRFVSNDTYLFWSKRCIPEPGDIVFTREAPMGEAAIIPADKQICLGQRTMLIRPIRQVTSENYLLIALMDPMFRQRAEQIAVGTGVKHLRVGDVSELQLPLPPTEEQQEIIRRVEILFAFADRLEARLATARKQAEQLTPALLAKAFRGELVPQDPNDEPASELLKRLAVQREAAPKAKRGKKAV